MKSVLLVSHGSRSAKTKEEVMSLVKVLQTKTGIPIFEFAFLEIESPSISEGLDRCVQKGAKQVTILLNFLNSGRHVNTDIPLIVQEAQSKYPDIKFCFFNNETRVLIFNTLFTDITDLLHKLSGNTYRFNADSEVRAALKSWDRLAKEWDVPAKNIAMIKSQFRLK